MPSPILNEQNPDNSKRTIYVLLIRTHTMFSRFICSLTKATYTHASLGISSGGCEYYSFARKYTHLPLPGGFVNEEISSGLMGNQPKTPCALLSISVSEEAYESLCTRLNSMSKRRKTFKYSLKGVFFCFFHHPTKYENKYFCSEFVADALQSAGIINLYKPASLYHPVDFIKHPELSICYEGTLGGLKTRLASN